MFDEVALLQILIDELALEGWNQYARYHSGEDTRELRQQLLNCPDRAL